MSFRRILCGIITVAMLLTAMGTIAFAADGDVAQIGDQTYATLKDAVQKVEDGGTIVLLQKPADTDGFDCREDAVGKTFSIDHTAVSYLPLSSQKGMAYYYKSGGVYAADYSVGNEASHIRSSGTGDVYIYTPIEKSGVNFEAIMSPLNKSWTSVNDAEGQTVYYYPSINDALNTTKSGYDYSVILLKDIDEPVQLSSTKGPSSGKTLNVVLNGHDFRGLKKKTAM